MTKVWVNPKKLKMKTRTPTTMGFKKKALKNRTDAELWAEGFIEKYFEKSEFKVEYVFKFRRFDFYFRSAKIALEIDGPYHSAPFQKNKDRAGDSLLYKHFKIKVFRVNNFDQFALENSLFQIRRIIDKKQEPSFERGKNGNSSREEHGLSRKRSTDRF